MDMSLNSWSSVCVLVVLGLYSIWTWTTYMKYPTIWWCVRMLNICESSSYCRYVSENKDEVGAPMATPSFWRRVVFRCLKWLVLILALRWI
jgi:hypothetical protein